MNPFDALITFCYTSDLEQTASFYENTLGLPLVLDQGGCRIYRVSERAHLGFCGRRQAGRPEGVILTLVTHDVDGWYAHLCRLGVDFEHAPRHNEEYRIYHCFFRDPNGYLLEIQRFDDPAWDQPGERTRT